MTTGKYPTVVLVSGNGTNLKAIIENCQNINIKAVITNNDKAKAMNVINESGMGIPYIVNIPKPNDDRETYDVRLINHIEMVSGYSPLIILAGYMRILSSTFINYWKGQGTIVNIHPSLLPKHKGLNTHEKVLKAHDEYHGITIHFVTEMLDSGPIILQRKLKVRQEDTVEILETRIHELEYLWYPAVIDVLAATMMYTYL